MARRGKPPFQNLPKRAQTEWLPIDGEPPPGNAEWLIEELRRRALGDREHTYAIVFSVSGTHACLVKAIHRTLATLTKETNNEIT